MVLEWFNHGFVARYKDNESFHKVTMEWIPGAFVTTQSLGSLWESVVRT